MEANNAADLGTLSDDLFTQAEFHRELVDDTGFCNYSYWQCTFNTFFRSPLIKAVVVVVLALILFTFIFPYISDADPHRVSLSPKDWNQPPGDGHPFGTAGVGRDTGARVWYGTRTSLLLALVVAVLEVGSGVVIGSLWGYYRQLDTLMFGIYNTITNIPSTIYLVVIAYTMKPSLLTIVIALVSSGWIAEARWFRNKILALREADYNTASTCLKTPPSRIVSRNIVPHIVSLIIMEAALTIPASIGSEVFLSFIGLGIPAEMVTLGNLVNQGRKVFFGYPFQMIFPTVILGVITVSFYIIGNKFADASDPRNHV